MKLNILKYILVVFLGLALFSCEDVDQDTTFYDTVKLNLSASTFTVLDSELPVTIDFVSKTKTVTDVVILKGETTISSGTAVDNKYSFTLNRSDFSELRVDDPSTEDDDESVTVRIYVNATVDGKIKEMYTTIDLIAATSIRAPFKVVLNDDGDEEEVDDSVYELSNVVKNFTYEVEPSNATAVNVKAEVKIGEGGTYTTIFDKPYDENDLNIGITGSNYTKGDKLFVRLVASVGTFTDEVISSIVISEYLIGEVESAAVSADVDGYDLITNEAVDVTSDLCMIQFTDGAPNGLSLKNTEFVLLTSEQSSEKNLPVLKGIFDAGVKIATLADVAAGNKYVVKTIRDTKDYYGTFLITSVSNSVVPEDDFVAFDYTIEEYDVEK